MKLIDLLKSLATKGKLDLNKPENNAVLEASKDIDVPQEFADQLEGSLMTVEAASAHKDVRSRIQAEVLNGEDAYLNSILGEMNIDEAVKEEIKGAPDTRARMRKSIEVLNKGIKVAKKSGDNITEEALKQQVADLNKQLKTIKDAHDQELNTVKAARDNDYINYELMAMLGAKQYALPENMPAKQKLKTALLIIQDGLAQKNLKVVKTETGLVKLVKADGTDPYNDKNTLLELPSFIDGALAENGLLKNSDPSQGNQNGSHNSLVFQGSSANEPVLNTGYLKELDTQIAASVNGMN